MPTVNFAENLIPINNINTNNDLRNVKSPLFKLQLSEWHKSSDGFEPEQYVGNIYFAPDTNSGMRKMCYIGDGDGDYMETFVHAKDRSRVVTKLNIRNTYIMYTNNMKLVNNTIYTSTTIAKNVESNLYGTTINLNCKKPGNNDGFFVYATFVDGDTYWAGIRNPMYKYTFDSDGSISDTRNPNTIDIFWVKLNDSGSKLTWSIIPIDEYGNVSDTTMITTVNSNDGTLNVQIQSTMPASAGISKTPDGNQIDPAYAIKTFYSQGEYDAVAEYSLSSLKNVIGMPFQFLSNADARIANSGYGKRYLDNIVYDAPFATLIPGYSYVGNDENKTILDNVTDSISKLTTFVDAVKDNGLGNTLVGKFRNALTGTYSSFFKFSPDNKVYADYVNSLVFLFVHYLGIENLEMPNSGGRKYYTYDWFKDEFNIDNIDNPTTMNNDALSFTKFFGSIGSIYLCYEPESQFTQRFSNTTKQSDIENKIMSFSSYFKEMNYFNSTAAESTPGGLENIKNTFASLAGNGGLARLFRGVSEGLECIVKGHNMRLPEMYDHSETGDNKRYDMTITLASPYADPESVFLYQLKPLAKLLALALPRQLGPNSYGSPFMVQAFSKGEFNCQLGIVDSLTIARSGDDKNSRSVYGIPTELKVTLSISDLYSETTLTNIFGTNYGGELLANNIGLTDFLASFCGYNLNSSEIDRMLNVLVATINRKILNSVDLNALSKGDVGHMFPQINRSFADSVQKETARLSTLINTY